MNRRDRGVTAESTCAVTYRATAAGGEEAEIRLRIDRDAATVSDAWARLSARYGCVDPMSIEIEIREVAGAAAA